MLNYTIQSTRLAYEEVNLELQRFHDEYGDRKLVQQYQMAFLHAKSDGIQDPLTTMTWTQNAQARRRPLADVVTKFNFREELDSRGGVIKEGHLNKFTFRTSSGHPTLANYVSWVSLAAISLPRVCAPGWSLGATGRE